ncbi:MAG: alpha-amylase [Anaeromyxobacter sp.]|nr:alpha-amylase [Anaeromyxobacter sp.]MBL0275850.1 alpha-amylase [Anaeromyxobacter sp.]
MPNSTRRHRPILSLLFVALAVLGGACGGGAADDGRWHPGQRLTVQVGSYFPAGTLVRDGYGGQTATVDAAGAVSVEPTADGVLLLERADAGPQPFTWKNAVVYFVVTDRFLNGDTANDDPYGVRRPDQAGEVATWHGGDFAGLASKLDYIRDLGATAIWITPPVEQVHGWVSGGGGVFKSYGYHGYWALDFTRIDRNLGTEAELEALVDGAHQRGLRVLFDVVMNHPGYATGDDLAAYLPAVLRDPSGDAFRAFTPAPPRGYDAWNDLVNYGSTGWTGWWSPSWIRAGFPGFQECGKGTGPACSDLTSQLAFLPDFVTEGTQAAGRPAFFAQKADTGFTAELFNQDATGFTLQQYLVKWHGDWVRRFGVDGFRCDTAKHVEKAAWKALKVGASAALQDWKVANPDKRLTDADLAFWMTGEVFPHDVSKDAYYTEGGFDSLINTAFQDRLITMLSNRASLVEASVDLDAIYRTYAGRLAGDAAFDALTYASSHDTKLVFEALGRDVGRQRRAGTALLLTPGGVQIFYGDESGRRAASVQAEPTQGTRSDMNWATTEAAVLDHWKKVATFRKRHPAIGAGAHEPLTSKPGSYAFGRRTDADAVVVVLTGVQ